MRVIGGSSRGRQLPARLPPGVRPTSDRVREAIFDIVGSMGGVEGLAVADLFCGSGALGAEALSRGAASVAFVDRDRSTLEAVRKNLLATGLAAPTVGFRPGAHVLVRAELPAWLHGAGHFDLALCDPPYSFSAWSPLLGALDATVAVLESSTPVEVPDGWSVTRCRRYGGTLVTVVHMPPDTPSPGAVSRPTQAASR